MKLINEISLPAKCSFCDRPAVEIIFYYIEGIFERTIFGCFLFCHDDNLKYKKQSREGQLAILKGKVVL